MPVDCAEENVAIARSDNSLMEQSSHAEQSLHSGLRHLQKVPGSAGSPQSQFDAGRLAARQTELLPGEGG